MTEAAAIKFIAECVSLSPFLIKIILQYCAEQILNKTEQQVVNLIEDFTPLPQVLIRILRDYIGLHCPGRHKFKLNNVEFDTDRKYFPIGSTLQPNTCLVENYEDLENRKSCIKKYNLSNNERGKKVLREIQVFKHLDHPNIIKIYDLIPPRDLAMKNQMKEIYMVQETMETTLHRVIYSRQKLSNEHLQFFLYQILKTVHYLRLIGIENVRLQPSSFLVGRDCKLKLCDLGWRSHSSHGTNEDEPFNYWPPDEAFYCRRHSLDDIVIWQIGCIFGELLGRKILFEGEDYMAVLRSINQTIEQPSQEDLDFLPTPTAKRYIEMMGPRRKPNWNEKFPHATAAACDLLDQMLQFNSMKRIHVAEALKHEYFKSIYRESEILECPPIRFSWLSELDVQELLWKEIYHFRPHLQALRENN